MSNPLQYVCICKKFSFGALPPLPSPSLFSYGGGDPPPPCPPEYRSGVMSDPPCGSFFVFFLKATESAPLHGTKDFFSTLYGPAFFCRMVRFPPCARPTDYGMIVPEFSPPLFFRFLPPGSKYKYYFSGLDTAPHLLRFP